MAEPRYGQKELEANNRRQLEARLQKEREAREEAERRQKTKDRRIDRFRFWVPTLIALGSLIVSIVSILQR